MSILDAALELWPHNEFVTSYDTDVNDAILRALDNNTAPEFDRSDMSPDAMTAHVPQVRLLFVKEDPAPVPLLDVLMAETLPMLTGPCDRCLADVTPVARLWVPAGASVIQIECCSSCVADLPDSRWV